MGNLDLFQYRFQPIKFVNLLVPSPCGTHLYSDNKKIFWRLKINCGVSFWTPKVKTCKIHDLHNYARRRAFHIGVPPDQSLVKIVASRFLFFSKKYQTVPSFGRRNVPVNSKTAHPPRAIPGHLTRVKLRKVGNLTQNEARPVGHLTLGSKRLSAVGGKKIS